MWKCIYIYIYIEREREREREMEASNSYLAGPLGQLQLDWRPEAAHTFVMANGYNNIVSLTFK